MSNPEQDQLIDQFVNVTNSSKSLAEQYLARNQNDLINAIEDYYASSSNTGKSSNSSGNEKTRKLNTSGGVRTLRDLNNNEEDDEEEKTDTNFFTGGEKSALQVEDPNKDKKNERSIIDQIFQRAKEQMDQPDDRPSARQEAPEEVRKFTGTGFKLGGDNQPSEEIADVNANLPKRPAKVTREITFWRQGFTVGEGALHRYDDPNNASVLQELNAGRVPMSLLDVEFGQDVDVSVFKKTDEDWVPPKRKLGGFEGQGQRLGSPVPGESLSGTPVPEAVPAATQETKPEDKGEGDSLVQIRFANGKRISHKFNSTDSIKTVYDFVRHHPYTESSKSFILSHAFPVKPIEESEDLTVGDAKLKNAVIVQRWI